LTRAAAHSDPVACAFLGGCFAKSHYCGCSNESDIGRDLTALHPTVPPQVKASNTANHLLPNPNKSRRLALRQGLSPSRNRISVEDEADGQSPSPK
jgi:hypothetical protein